MPARIPALAQRLLNLVLFVTVLTSSIAFIEPAPHDGLMMVLLVTCVGARVGFDRKLIPLLLLIVLWLVGGLMSLMQVGDQAKDIQYAGTSIYLGIAALMFACLFCDGNLVRLAILRRGYILAALIATAAGYIGFFHLLPGADIFLDNDRVSATFKDPNVYGPFLIFPIVWLLVSLLVRGIRLLDVAVLMILLGGLLLSFSRGAWTHFVISTVVGIGIVLAVTPDPRMRARIVVLGLLGATVVALLVVALASIGSVHDMIIDRAKAIQPYDVGPGGRFWLQQQALGAILDNPERSWAVRIRPHLRAAAAQRLYAGLSGVRLARRRRLSGAGRDHAAARVAHGLNADPVAILSDHRLRGLRRRGLRRADRRHRSLAPLFSRARNGLGTGGSDDQFPPPAGMGARC